MNWTPATIRALRQHLGKSQSELAEMLGMGRLQRVSDLETGRREPSGPVRKLLDTLARRHRFKG
jgi:DNA-binding transcriptional regulator YiaG